MKIFGDLHENVQKKSDEVPAPREVIYFGKTLILCSSRHDAIFVRISTVFHMMDGHFSTVKYPGFQNFFSE